MDNRAVSNQEEFEKVANQAKNEEMTEKKPSRGKAILFAALTFIVFLAIQIVVSIIATSIKGAAIMMEVNGDMNLYLDRYMEAVKSIDFLAPVLFVTEIITIGIGLLWYGIGFVKKTTKEEKVSKNKKVFTVKTLATCVLLGIGFLAIDLIIANIVAVISPSAEATFESTTGLVIDKNNIYSVLAVALLAPIAEEIFFRGVALNSLKKSFPKWGAIIGSSLLFACMHLIPMQVVYAIPIAVAMGYVAYRYNSILPTIIIHIVNNLIATYQGDFPEAIFGNYIGLIIVAVVCIGLTILIQKDNLFKKTADN